MWNFVGNYINPRSADSAILIFNLRSWEQYNEQYTDDLGG